MHVVIFTGGNFIPSTLSQQVIKTADTVIAADSGANTAVKLGIFPEIVVGDLDSIDTATKKVLQTKKTPFITSPTEKDETDTELAVDYAIQHGATKITLLGGIAGDRFDHIVANLFLATKYKIPIMFIQGKQISWIAKGPSEQIIRGKKGDLLSLIPLQQDAIGITTKHLYYPLNNGTLTFGRPRGISNVLTKNHADVSFEKGILLFVHTIHG